MFSIENSQTAPLNLFFIWDSKEPLGFKTKVLWCYQLKSNELKSQNTQKDYA